MGDDVYFWFKIAALVYLALAIDMTARNMQEIVKKKGLPWSAVKGFDTFTPIRYVRVGLSAKKNDFLLFPQRVHS